MKFKEFLAEEERKIVFTTFASDGTVVCYINGKRYEYITDAYYHSKWKKMVRFSPWKVLNIIKDLVKSGAAQQIDPPPSPIEI